MEKSGSTETTSISSVESFKKTFSKFELSQFLSCFNVKSFYGKVNPEYLIEKQSKMTQKSRAFLINWMLLIHQKFCLQTQTIFTAINIFDAYCSKISVLFEQFQLLALTALFSAAKFEEVKPPKLTKFLTIAENQFSACEVINFEAEVMTEIGFKVSSDSPFQLLEIMAEFSGMSHFLLKTALGFLISSCFDLRMYYFGIEEIVESSILLAKRIDKCSRVFVDHETDFGSKFSLNFCLAGEKNSMCMKNMSLIVMNLERAGLFAIRKAFSGSR